VGAAGISENPQNTAAGDRVATSLEAYNCANQSETTRVSHIGQHVNGTYYEWLQRYGGDGANVNCITLLTPQARDLSKNEAVALLSGNLTLSAGSSAGGGIERSMSFGSRATAGATTRAALSTTDAAPETAVLDLGFPKTADDAPARASGESVERAQALGSDDRQPVPDKSAYPWSLIGQLIVTWKDGTQDLCTGVLMSPHVVLTAGQCVHNRSKGGFASKVSFAPGQSQTSPTGELVRLQNARYADYVETNNRWTQISGADAVQTNNTRSDYAALYFTSPWGATTYMPVIYGDTTTGAFNTAGYPTDFGNAKAISQDMKYSSGAETSRSVNLLRAYQVREFAMDVSSGQNGSPIWTFDGTTRAVTGLVSYGGDEVAGGVWFGAENQTIINTFVQWSPSQPGPTNLADDLRLPFVFSSGNLSTDSYLRFYNATPQAGTVRVTFYDEETGLSLGVWESPTIPPFASKQFAISVIEPQTVPRIVPSKPNQRYTVGVTANFPGYFQHVVWNRNGQSLTNLSGCDNGAADDAIHMSNVHSSLITAYPSLIVAHNIGAKGADAIIGVFDSESGQRLGAVRVPGIPAGGSVALQLRDIEAVLGIKPVTGVGPYHYNLVQEGDFPGYLQHMVSNLGAGVITNMTQKCAFAVR
jgi:V8-like Glu-specific endopeptidase